jgi:hypothetical protein
VTRRVEDLDRPVRIEEAVPGRQRLGVDDARPDTPRSEVAPQADLGADPVSVRRDVRDERRAARSVDERLEAERTARQRPVPPGFPPSRGRITPSRPGPRQLHGRRGRSRGFSRSVGPRARTTRPGHEHQGPRDAGLTTAPAPIRLWRPMWQPLRTTAFMAMRTSSSTVDASIAPWPRVTRSMSVGRPGPCTAGVLHIALGADGDRLQVPAHHGVEPDRGVPADDHFDQGRPRR